MCQSFNVNHIAIRGIASHEKIYFYEVRNLFGRGKQLLSEHMGTRKPSGFIYRSEIDSESHKEVLGLYLVSVYIAVKQIFSFKVLSFG